MTILRRIGMAVMAGSAVLVGALPAGAGVFAHYTFDTNYADSSGHGWDGTLVEILKDVDEDVAPGVTVARIKVAGKG